MAFYMEPKNAVDVNNIDYDNYIIDIFREKWAVVGPISLAGGGSIHLGTYGSKDAALECIKSYLTQLIEERCIPNTQDPETHLHKKNTKTK